jgi:hypothetical protein
MLETPKALAPSHGTAQEMSTMDNQQERLWSWLGGFIDGEGCFGIYRKRTAGKLFHYPILDIVNTNPLDIDRAASLIMTITGCHIESSVKGEYLPKWSLRVLGFKRMRALLPHLIPFLYGKQEEAKLLLGFCESAQDTTVREDFKARLRALKNPQRLYAEPFAHVRMDEKVQQTVKAV